MKKPSYPSRQVLEETPYRVLAFLNGVAASAAARDALAAHGYTRADHESGCAALHRIVSGRSMADPLPPTETPAHLVAMHDLEAFRDGPMRRARAALAHLAPEDVPRAFDGIAPGKGVAAVIAVETFLDRTSRLSAGTRNVLRARGITEEVVEQLRERIRVAKALPEIVVPRKDSAAREAALRSLRAWFDDWALTARTVMPSRNLLIRLGLAKRRAKTATSRRQSPTRANDADARAAE